MPTRHQTETPDTKKSSHSPGKAEEHALWEGLQFLSESWNFSGTRIAELLHLSATTVNHWLRAERIPIERKPVPPDIEALLHLVAIHRSLHAMFRDSTNQVAWLEQKHPDFGCPPISVMEKSLAGLISVRQYLDYVRGRGA